MFTLFLGEGWNIFGVALHSLGDFNSFLRILGANITEVEDLSQEVYFRAALLMEAARMVDAC